jgi:hypothetical protein
MSATTANKTNAEALKEIAGDARDIAENVTGDVTLEDVALTTLMAGGCAHAGALIAKKYAPKKYSWKWGAALGVLAGIQAAKYVIRRSNQQVDDSAAAGY